MKRIKSMRPFAVTMFGTVTQAVGFGAIAYAAWEVERVAGIVVAGVLLVLYGRYVGR